MLVELCIDNFAIIHHLDLELSAGLVTLTGETGAGKSIIFDAILALVGGRTDASLVRSGSDRAMVEATFRIPESSRKEIEMVLEREDLKDDANYLVLARELRREGRTTARVNGRMVNVSLLQELGGYLVDIHGQSEHLSLLNYRQHLGLLDRYAASEKLLEAYRETYSRLQKLRRELDDLRREESEAARLTDLLTYQVQEIESAQLKSGEDEILKKERDRLANAEALSAEAQQCLLILDEGAGEAPPVSDLVGQVERSLTNLCRIDPSQAQLLEQSETVLESLSDLSRSLRDYLEEIEYNPRRLEQVEERLELIQNLKRKYGGNIETVLAHAADASQRLETIAHAAERITELEADEKTLLDTLGQQGLALSNHRRTAAAALSTAVDDELGDLNMAGAHFWVDVRYLSDANGVDIGENEKVAFDENGLDRVEFLIAPNPGEGLKPLVKIASGGETSRLMLALKNVLARVDHIPTLIFDEIDQGIGGRTGMVVGEKLWQLGRRHQVLCVTHLPQLAAFGDQHLGVRKKTEDGRTITQVQVLDEKMRLDELAQMLGSLSDVHREAAQETLQQARHRASELASGNKVPD